MATRLLIPFLFFVCVFKSLAAQSFVPGQVYYSADSAIEYRCGNLPLILSAPHGGYLSPVNYPDRICPDAVTVRDGFTQELTRAIDSLYVLRHGCHPHVVINRLARTKLDPNRDLPIATCDNPQALAAWTAYHTFLDSARAVVTRQFGKGLVLDIHGHAHAIARIELGYQLTGEQLRESDSAINSPFRVQRSGIRSLVQINLPQNNHLELLRGENALGTTLQTAGYPSVPSQLDPYPMTSEPYFSGAYITGRHGSSGGGTIDAIQLEHYMSGIRDNAPNRSKYADTLRAVINRYLATHYFGNTAFLSSCSALPNTISAVQEQNSWFKLYPNPSSTFFIDAETQGELMIYDLLGKCLLKLPLIIGKQEITPPLPPGGYLVAFRSTNQTTGWIRWVKTQ